MTRFLLLTILALLLIRLLVAPFAVLIPEEAYYWKYSKHLAWGYLDHPPLVAWVIAGGTHFFGDTEFGVRLGTLILSVGSLGLMYRLAADWYGRQAGIMAALLYSIAPLFFAAGFLAMPDAPLMFLWLLALLSVTRAYQRDSLGMWLLAGLSTGLAFLAKYPAAMLGLSTVVFLLSDQRGRLMLRGPGVWLGAAVACLAASPVIWWNLQHDWASFRFQFLRRASEYDGFQPLTFLSSLSVQLLVLTPLPCLLLGAAVWVGLRRFRHDPVGRWRFAVCFSVPWLLVCVIHGLFAEVRMNWPIPAYLSLLPSAAALLRRASWSLMRRLDPDRVRGFMARYAGVMLGVNAVTALLILGALPWLPIPSAFMRWDELGAAAEIAEESLCDEYGVDPFIIADGRYNVASELAFYMRDERDDDWNETIPLAAAFGGGLNYSNWHTASEFRGRNAIFISRDPSQVKLNALREAFAEVGQPRELVTLSRGGSRAIRFWVVSCIRFIGIPTQAGARDIGGSHS